MIFSQNLISILLSKPDKQADMQMSFFGADPLPKTPDHQKKFVAHQNSNFFILSYALMSMCMHDLWLLAMCCDGGPTGPLCIIQSFFGIHHSILSN